MKNVRQHTRPSTRNYDYLRPSIHTAMAKSIKKIINDPVHGFIDIPNHLGGELIEHRYFQRLRGVKQLGLTHLVYPGAVHTRFQHAIGAMHLMKQAIDVLRSKDHDITHEEEEAAICAILLHDVGHGPFSHALEFSIVEGISHEQLSLLMMHRLNEELGGRLTLAIDIFTDKYPKRFLHQLISSQLDVDRLDYLTRDSFFTGVVEGSVGLDRIIKMLEVVNDELVVEAKGIYSIEKFLIARRLMYWQVYLHKTVVAAEQLLIQVFKRARECLKAGVPIYTTPILRYFLEKRFSKRSGTNQHELIDNFVTLDDADIVVCLKEWERSGDFILSNLCRMLNSRNIFKIELGKLPFTSQKVTQKSDAFVKATGMDESVAAYFVLSQAVSNKAYSPKNQSINILDKSGQLESIEQASDVLNSAAFERVTTKYFLCYPKTSYEFKF